MIDCNQDTDTITMTVCLNLQYTGVTYRCFFTKIVGNQIALFYSLRSPECCRRLTLETPNVFWSEINDKIIAY